MWYILFTALPLTECKTGMQWNVRAVYIVNNKKIVDLNATGKYQNEKHAQSGKKISQMIEFKINFKLLCKHCFMQLGSLLSVVMYIVYIQQQQQSEVWEVLVND